MQLNIFTKFFLLCLITSCTCKLISIGGWKKDSFARDDLSLDRSRSTAMKQYLKEYNLSEDDIIFHPLAVYKQITNGMNYKIVLACQNLVTKTINIYECVVNVSRDFETFNVLSSKSLPYENNVVDITNPKFIKINDYLNNVLSRSHRNLKYINLIQRSEFIISEDDVYIINASIQDENDISFVLVEQDGEFDLFYELTYKN